MTSFERVPVVDVHTDNFKEIWPSLILAMSSSSFVALDTELSGLGHRKLLNAKSVEDRYKSISDTARSRSILSLGISCFKLQAPPPALSSNCQSELTEQSDESISQSGDRSDSQSKWRYFVQTFNITILCEEDYVVEPASLRFLVQHGFDFNRQYDKGVSYYRGNDKASDSSIQSIRHLFTELISMKLPIVVHNGLVDLVFLYQNLYCTLPSTSASFLADLVDLFPNGIIDTKYVTDFEHMMQASYLEYVFRKCQRDNSLNASGCDIQFPVYPSTYCHVTFRECSLKPPNDLSHLEDPRILTCDTYTGHGWCTKGQFCPKSHDIDLIIDIDDFTKDKKSRKRKRRKQNQLMKRSGNNNDSIDMTAEGDWKNDSVSMETNDDEECDGVDFEDTEKKIDKLELERSTPFKAKNSVNAVQVETQKEESGHDKTCKSCGKSTNNVSLGGGHRAGYDAFMTGLIYAVYLSQIEASERDRKIGDWKNKLYLSGKDYPLSVSKSNFVKQSKEHLDKIARIRKVNSS